MAQNNVYSWLLTSMDSQTGIQNVFYHAGLNLWMQNPRLGRANYIMIEKNQHKWTSADYTVLFKGQLY